VKISHGMFFITQSMQILPACEGMCRFQCFVDAEVPTVAGVCYRCHGRRPRGRDCNTTVTTPTHDCSARVTMPDRESVNFVRFFHPDVAEAINLFHGAAA